MALGLSLGDRELTTTHDTYVVPGMYDPSNACRVHIFCPGKKLSIFAMMSEGFNIDVKSNWKGLFEGAIGGLLGGGLLDIGDNIAQFLGGVSIRQPWFGRKYWTGTTPLKFRLGFQFVSFLDAKEEVFKPMKSLLSLLYPRITSTGDAGLLSTYIIPGANIFYNVPRNTSGDKGDRVEIYLGNFLRFKGCYISDINLVVENSFSTDGFPHCVKANMIFETMDVAYVENDGSFMEDGFKDASVDIGGMFAQVQGLAAGFGETLVKGGKKGVGLARDAVNAVRGFLPS